MAKFTDNAGREWTVEANVSTVERVRKDTGFDLNGLAGFDLISDILDDPVLQTNIIYCMIEKQASKTGVSEDDFKEAMGGESLDTSAVALLQEMKSFFRNCRKREAFAKNLEMALTMEEAALNQALKELDIPNMKSVVNDGMEKVFASIQEDSESQSGKQSGRQPESSE